MGFFAWIWNGIQWLGGLILPFLAKAKDVRSLGHKLRWVFHFTFLVLVLAGLGFLNYVFDLEKLIEAPLPFLRKIWLPLLFLLVYLLSWLGWWLWLLLGAEEESSEHPDLDAAWEEAVAALGAAGIDVSAVPLFLVLGKPAGSEDALFHGSQLDFTVMHVPKNPDAPLHIYAGSDGIFVTCPEASLLGRQAALLAKASGRESVKRPAEGATIMAPSANESDEEPPPNIPSAEQKQGTLLSTEEEKEEHPHQAAEEETGASPRLQPPASRLPPASLLKDPAEVERLQARLKHLCWLILQERRPYCPVNGVLLLVPFAATNGESEANQIGLIAQRDVSAVREVLQINCPVFVLVSDMESAPGFRDFIDRFPKGHRQRRLGQQFPYVADLTPATAGQLIDAGVQWICLDLFPALIYRLMRPEKPGHDESAAIRGNARLYRLLGEMRERRKRLSRLLSLAVAVEDREPILFGGCYLAGTGRDAAHEQAFIAAVFQRLLESQNYVSWTAAGRAEETAYRRWSRYGYAALGSFAASLVVLGYFFILRR